MTQKQVPLYWKTGIKVDRFGKKCYRADYKCECGHGGRRYVWLGTKYIECHECGYHLHLTLSGRMQDGEPTKGKAGCFFHSYAIR